MERRAKFSIVLCGSRAAGFTLLELLIAVVVTSIGLLGIAALQATGLRDNHGAYLRTQATYVANDIADRMRANMNATIAGSYRINLNTPPTAPAAPANPGFNCIDNFRGTNDGGQCTPGELARTDLFQWYTSLRGGQGVQPLLPAGEASIACNDSNATDGDACTRGSLHTITVRWDGGRTGATGRNCPPVNGNDLFCVRVALRP
jgi:type IV pilus assembly protein PilV